MTEQDDVLHCLSAESEAAFNEPWEARAFALAVSLHKAGRFAWDDFAAQLGEQLRVGNASRPYYGSWLAALEHVLDSAMIAPVSKTTERAEELQAMLKPGHDHAHHHDHDDEADHHHEPLSRRARPVAIA